MPLDTEAGLTADQQLDQKLDSRVSSHATSTTASSEPPADDGNTQTRLQKLRELAQDKRNSILVVCFILVTVSFALRQLSHHHRSVGGSIGSSKPITEKPKADVRNYRYETLPNGINVIAVQDPASKKAAFSVAVNAGSFDNPLDFPGLAHFCEHMLFLGTKQYPGAGEFDKFMAKAGGNDNAFTAEEHTVYFGELSAPWMDEGLKRFSDFFRAPLFNESFVSKEVNAIDSEHAKNVQSGGQRIIEIFNKLSNPETPVGRFSTGNKDTLLTIPEKKGLNTVSALREFFNSHYCPSRMVLATFGPEPLDTQLARARSLSDITAGSSDCEIPRKSYASPPAWPKHRLGKLLSIEGIDPQPMIWMHFPLPDIQKEYKSGAMSYINYVVTYGGEGGLLRLLQDKLGYVTSLDFSSDGGSAGTDTYLIVSFTKSGLENYEKVLDLIFLYLGTLNSQDVDMDLYQSLADASNLEWEWSDSPGPSDTVSGLAEKAFRVPLDELLTGGGRMDTLDPELVKRLIGLISPSNMNMALVTQNMKFDKGADVQVLEYYGAKYVVAELPEHFGNKLKMWNDADSRKSDDPLVAEITKFLPRNQLPLFPKAIQGVPKEINTEHMTAEQVTHGPAAEQLYGKRPQPIEDSDPTLLYREGWLAKSPKVSIKMVFEVPRAADDWGANLVDAYSLNFYNSLMAEELEPKVYDLSMTGVSYSVNYGRHQVSFGFGGFPPLMPQLMDKVLSALDDGVNVSSDKRFKRLVAETREDLNTFADMSISYAIEDRNLLLTPGSTSRKEKLAALEQVTAEGVASSVRRLLKPKPMKVTGLVMGNTDTKEAISSFTKIKRHLQDWPGQSKQPADGQQVRRVVPVVKLSQPVEVRRLNQRPGDPNDVTVVTIEAGLTSVANRINLGLISSVLGNVAYDYLRTNLQLGYVVSGGISKISNIHVVTCVVQGDKLKADEAQGAIHKVFADILPAALDKMTADEFESYKDALRQELLEPPTAPRDEVDHFWGKVTSDEDCWGLQDALLKQLDNLKDKKVLIELWRNIMSPTSGTRKILTVKHFASAVPERPTLAESKAIWKAQGLSPQAIKLLTQEYNDAETLSDVSSDEREQLMKSGASLYPTSMNCDAAAVADIEDSDDVDDSALEKGNNYSPYGHSTRLRGKDEGHLDVESK
jgi:insulysin